MKNENKKWTIESSNEIIRACSLDAALRKFRGNAASNGVVVSFNGKQIDDRELFEAMDRLGGSK